MTDTKPKQKMKYENKRAELLGQLCEELLDNINMQAEAVSGMIKVFGAVDFNTLATKDRQRFRALKAYADTMLTNLQKFQIERSSRILPAETRTEAELMIEFEKLCEFQLGGIEHEDYT